MQLWGVDERRTHRIVRIGRGLWRSSPAPLPGQSHLQQVAQEHIPVGLGDDSLPSLGSCKGQTAQRSNQICPFSGCCAAQPLLSRVARRSGQWMAGISVLVPCHGSAPACASSWCSHCALQVCLTLAAIVGNHELWLFLTSRHTSAINHP